MRTSAELPDHNGRLGAPRRPAETYIMERLGERCEVRIERVGAPPESVGNDFPCPRDLEVGERVRLAGRVCVRESEQPERRLLMVCPDYLTNAERDVLRARQASSAAP